jgi:ABC-2 type transport system ATP-binding protein
VLHQSNIGRVHTLIVRGNPDEAVAYLTAGKENAIVDVLPLSLEEIFIYEMGGVDYEVKDFLL